MIGWRDWVRLAQAVVGMASIVYMVIWGVPGLLRARSCNECIARGGVQWRTLDECECRGVP